MASSNFYQHFVGKKDDEIVLQWIKKHRIVQLKVLFKFIVIGLLPLLIILLILFWVADFYTFYVVMSFYIVYLMYVLIYSTMCYFDEVFDVLIITNSRIIASIQKNLFTKSFIETSLDNIQEVYCNIKGFWQSFLNYGDVTVETAGTSRNLTMEYVPRPVITQRNIVKIAEQCSQVYKKGSFKKINYNEGKNKKN